MNSMIFFDKFIIIIIFISLGGMPPLLGFLGKIIILKILLSNFINMIIVFIIIMSSLLLLYFYLSRMYFYLSNIPSLKVNFKLRLFSLKKIFYLMSLIYINLFFNFLGLPNHSVMEHLCGFSMFPPLSFLGT